MLLNRIIGYHCISKKKLKCQLAMLIIDTNRSDRGKHGKTVKFAAIARNTHCTRRKAIFAFKYVMMFLHIHGCILYANEIRTKAETKGNSTQNMLLHTTEISERQSL